MRYMVTGYKNGQYRVLADDVGSYYDALKIAEGTTGMALIGRVVNVRSGWTGDWDDPTHREEWA